MFKGDLESQQRKLMDTLAFAIGNLKNPTILSGTLSSLAKRHVDYGVHQ
jgi:hemoglobin-like flavoprotein